MKIEKYRELVKELESLTVAYETSCKELREIRLALFIQDKENVKTFKRIGQIVESIIKETEVLSTREALILKSRFCKDKRYIKTYEELGKHLCISRSRVRYIEAMALSKILDN